MDIPLFALASYVMNVVMVLEKRYMLGDAVIAKLIDDNSAAVLFGAAMGAHPTAMANALYQSLDVPSKPGTLDLYELSFYVQNIFLWIRDRDRYLPAPIINEIISLYEEEIEFWYRQGIPASTAAKTLFDHIEAARLLRPEQLNEQLPFSYQALRLHKQEVERHRKR